MDDVSGRLLAHVETHGMAIRVVPADHLAELEAGLATWREQGMLDEELARVCLSRFAFAPPADLTARSLLVVANPQPQVEVAFRWPGGKRLAFIVPPGYLWRLSVQETNQALREALAPFGYTFAWANVPVKPLAVHSGLARYGRNNITYVPGMGSFHQLTAFFTDLPCTEDPWQELALLERCRDCTNCRRACPTAAIPEDRFLLRAERCLSWYNERPGEMPPWLNPRVHHTLVDCMRCQLACPENRAHREWIVPGPEFTVEETVLLLQGTPLDALPPETRATVERWGLADLLDVLPRNLRLAVAAAEAST